MITPPPGVQVYLACGYTDMRKGMATLAMLLQRSAPAGTTGVTVMTMTERKVIKAKVGLLELAEQLGSVTQACRVMGYSRDSFYRYVAAQVM
jgi:hypothetical protein